MLGQKVTQLPDLVGSQDRTAEHVTQACISERHNIDTANTCIG
jgi:hypothetical protein